MKQMSKNIGLIPNYRKLGNRMPLRKLWSQDKMVVAEKWGVAGFEHSIDDMEWGETM